MRSAEQRARRAEQERERRAAGSPASKRRNSVKKRERRAAESLASRQARLASVKAATRRHRQALESSIAENHNHGSIYARALSIVVRLQLLLRLGVRAVTPLIMTFLRTSYGSGSLGVMNARRLSHLKNAGASAALEIARQDVLADVQQHISLSTLDMAQCVSAFSAVNIVAIRIIDMRVCASCGTRDPESLTTRTLAR